MEVFNAIKSNEEQMAGFKEPDDGETIYMVNLLKFKDKAEYADGRETQLSGREAYDLYSKGVKECLAKVGGGTEFMKDVKRLALGSVEELWDVVAIARYPNRTAMLQMMRLPEFQAISHHRMAGLAGQLNIETVDTLNSRDW